LPAVGLFGGYGGVDPHEARFRSISKAGSCLSFTLSASQVLTPRPKMWFIRPREPLMAVSGTDGTPRRQTHKDLLGCANRRA
jgi:hypothetical protein